MNNGFSAILEKNSGIVFKNEYGMYRRISLETNIEERIS